MTTSPLLRPVTVGSLSLPNRVVMAPLTRNRAGQARVPTAMNAEYYRQRAGAGLIVSEATAVSPQGVGYIDTPGLWSDDQVRGWTAVTEAVHAGGGRIVAQLWHVGRISHTSFHDGRPPVSATDRWAEAMTFTEKGFEPTSAPRRLATDELPGVVADYAAATGRARDAGFDGVEVHAANGYLLEQFLASAVNDRTDGYGGSVEGRSRLLLEVVDATVAAWGSPDRVGVRLSLGNGTAGAEDEDPATVLRHLGEQLQARDLAYVHYVEARDAAGARRTDLTEALRRGWHGPFVLAGGFDRAEAEEAVARGRGDAVAFGRSFLANPDLPERFRVGAELNVADKATFYGGGAAGYTDYPFLDRSDDGNEAEDAA